jgi:hypothetical protein
MANRYTRTITTTAELAADHLDHRDEEVMHALVSAARSWRFPTVG